MGTPELSRKVPLSEQGGLPKSPSCDILLNIMKKVENNPIKMRSRLNPTEFYWTYSSWDSNFVDGVEFLPVTRFDPSDNRTKQLYYVRKDSLEKVRNV